MPIALAIVIAVGLSARDFQPPSQAECRDAAECRQQALEAASRQEYELFHDLAWRAMQKGRRNDAELMSLVARAQSLSGRPHDAVVMLNRLAAMGVTTDAATSDDFRRVRALPAWPDLEAQLAALDTTAAAKPSEPADKAVAVTGSKRPPEPPVAPPSTPPPAKEPDKAARSDPAPDVPIVGEPVETLRFSTAPFTPAGLAYDAVSNRFIVGDRSAKKLAVVGERSHNVSNFASADTAGFGDIAALAIDPREGDLWVVSTSEASGAVHKLQLISGRVLYSVPSPEGTSVRFGDLAVTPQSTVIALDVEGKRLFRLPRRSKELEVASTLDVDDPVSIATSSDLVAYVAYRDGIVRVDLSSGSARPVRAQNGIDLTGLTWIRRYRSGLVALQRTAGGLYRIIRLRQNASGTVTGLVLLDRDVPLAGSTAAAVSGDLLYYLSAAQAGAESGEVIVRRVKLR
jgi:hypothetical protein